MARGLGLLYWCCWGARGWADEEEGSDLIRGPREDIFGEFEEGRYSGSLYSDFTPLRCGPLCWKKGELVGSGALAKECEGGRAGIGGM